LCCVVLLVSQQCHFAGMQVFISMISCPVQCTLVGTHVENTTAECQLSMAADATRSSRRNPIRATS